MQACWRFFDDVRKQVSAEMQKGPRGGGRDRDRIVRHTFAAEQDWAKGIGVLTPDGAMLTDEGLKAHRDAYCQAIQDYHSQGKSAGTRAKWPQTTPRQATGFYPNATMGIESYGWFMTAQPEITLAALLSALSA